MIRQGGLFPGPDDWKDKLLEHWDDYLDLDGLTGTITQFAYPGGMAANLNIASGQWDVTLEFEYERALSLCTSQKVNGETRPVFKYGAWTPFSLSRSYKKSFPIDTFATVSGSKKIMSRIVDGYRAILQQVQNDIPNIKKQIGRGLIWLD
jgi:hypothetical protein